MIRLARRDRVMATGFAAIAGMVDAIGFLASGGFFLSFMSGNSTRLSVGLADTAPYVVIVAALIMCFVGGVVCGSLTGQSKTVTVYRRQAIISAGIAALLFVTPIVADLGWVLPAICIAAFAMGAENTLFEREGSVSFGLTYMTGALVKIGQGLAAMLRGGMKTPWAPYVYLWLGLVGGAAIGAILFSHYGIYGLWLPAALSASFAVMLLREPSPGVI